MLGCVAASNSFGMSEMPTAVAAANVTTVVLLLRTVPILI
jgi:hypothetical protein